MAIKTIDEIMASVKAQVGDSTDDVSLAFIEDIKDTITDLTTKANTNTGEDWKTKYEENDAMWRKKYSDRFFSAGDDDEIEPPEPFSPKIKTYNDLFKEV